MRERKWTLVTIAFLLGVPLLATADTSNPKLNLYLSEPDYMGCDAAVIEAVEALPCNEVVVPPWAPGPVKFLWVVASQPGGFAATGGLGSLRFGIEYTNIDSPAWTLCTEGAEIADPDWPAPGTGIMIAYEDACFDVDQENVRVGFLQLLDGEDAVVSLTGDPRIGEAQYVRCQECDEVGQFGFEDLATLNLSSGGTFECGAPVSVGHVSATPSRATLAPARPNPFGPRTTLAFTLNGDAGQVRMMVYDAAGRAVDTVVDRSFDAGSHVVSWDGLGRRGRPLPAGSYFYELRVDGKVVDRRKAVMLR